MRRVWAFVFALVGCTKPNPRSCLDGVCDDPRFPFCDVNGDIGGSPGTCIEGRCEPNVIAGCQDDDLVQCNANGTNFDTTRCDFGCQGTGADASCNLCEPNSTFCDGSTLSHCGPDGRVGATETCLGTCVATPGARCTHIVPRYLPNVCDAVAAQAELTISNSATFDTDLDANCNGGVILQAGAPNICVVRYGRIQLLADVELKVMGTRALALVSDEETHIAGYLDLSADADRNGPGGGTSFSGGEATEPCGGVGGAGFATRGGHGGSSTANGGANNGGAMTADPATLPVLTGGPRMGNEQVTAGYGGGAATIAACRGVVRVTGEVNAGGGGAFSFISGFGGGAGGNVVFQGMRIVLTGKLFANGGGGGAGPINGEGGAGFEGSRDAANGNGGVPVAGGAKGGRGGNGTRLPDDGSKMPNGAGCANGGGGGGGGSVGFLQTYTPVGVDPEVTPSVASPMPRPNANIPTQ